MRIEDLNEAETRAGNDAEIIARLKGTAKKDPFYDDPSKFIDPNRTTPLNIDPEKNVAITKSTYDWKAVSYTHLTLPTSDLV